MTFFAPVVIGWIVVYTGGLMVSYFLMRLLFPFFFRNISENPFKRSTKSLLWIIGLSIAGYIVVINIPIDWLANRVLHGFCGGFMAFFMSFRAYKDSSVILTKFQIFLFSLLIVTGLGVFNEIFECIMQNIGIGVYSDTINDTWFDLISNTTGALLAAAVFLPFLDKNSEINK